jgi:hypothetical protein
MQISYYISDDYIRNMRIVIELETAVFIEVSVCKRSDKMSHHLRSSVGEHLRSSATVS